MKNFAKVCVGMAGVFFMLAGAQAIHAEENFSRTYVEEDDDSASDPSDFEGDSNDMPGERAPENMPMDDAPVDAGIGAEI